MHLLCTRKPKKIDHQNCGGLSFCEIANKKQNLCIKKYCKAFGKVVFEDIFPDSVKIGMVSSCELICVIADRLKYYNAKNIVVDPVMVATSGSSLMKTDADKTLIDKLLPIATLVTPNIPEAEVLAGISVENKDDMQRAAKVIGDSYGCAVLLKGGHNINDANDLLYSNGEYQWFAVKCNLLNSDYLND